MFLRLLLATAWSLTALIIRTCKAGSAQVPLEDLGLGATGTTNNETMTGAGGCAEACALLDSIFGSEQVLSLQSNSALYTNFTDSYWSAFQSAVSPTCIFKPETFSELATQIRISASHQCPFAARSGGHSRFASSPSSPGITISLEHFNQISVNSAAGTANIGPGNRWTDIYTALQPHDLVVVGGRVAGIGIGRYTTGGGISFFANLHGWGCDNVVSYTLVAADGSIQRVTADSSPDLFWALRGGGPNFGIGAVTHPLSNFPALNAAFVSLATDGFEKDPKGGKILTYAQFGDSKTGVTQLAYTEPTANASVFDPYLSIEGSLSGTADLYIRTLANATLEMEKSSPSWFRQTYWTGTYRLTLGMTTAIQEMFFEGIKSILDLEGLVPACSLQGVGKRQVERMGDRGGNALGLDVEKAPYLVIVCSAQWMRPEDDGTVMRVYHGLIEDLKTYAREQGWDEQFLYMNYASEFQDVVAGYGKENQERLKRISREADPDQVFQRLRLGYFKLDGAPAQWPATYA